MHKKAKKVLRPRWVLFILDPGHKILAPSLINWIAIFDLVKIIGFILLLRKKFPRFFYSQSQSAFFVIGGKRLGGKK